MIEAREYTDAAQMLADARALRQRMFAPRPAPKPVARPLVRIVKPFLPAPVPVAPVPHPQPDEVRAAILETRGYRYAAQDFIARYAVWCGLTYEDMIGPSRKTRVSHPRQDCMAALHRVRPDLSLPQLGKLFGGRDHTTVLHGIRVSEERERIAASLPVSA